MPRTATGPTGQVFRELISWNPERRQTTWLFHCSQWPSGGRLNQLKRPPEGHWEQWNNHVVWRRSGFQLINSRKTWPVGPVAVRGIQFPYWCLTLLLALAPSLKLVTYLRHPERST